MTTAIKRGKTRAPKVGNLSQMTISRFFFLIALPACTGCATMLSGTSQKIPVASTPIGAEVIVNGKSVGKTPLVIELKRKDPATITLQAEGYKSHTTILQRKRSGWFWLIPTIYGIPSLIVDVVTGAAYVLEPKTVNIDFNPPEPVGPDPDPVIETQTKPSPDNQGFQYSNVTMAQRSNPLLGQSGVGYMGEITNNSGKDYYFATFKISLYGKDGGLIAIQEFTVFEIANGTTQSFDTGPILDSALKDQVESFRVRFGGGMEQKEAEQMDKLLEKQLTE